MGYYAEVDGSREIIKDDDELSEAVWLKREDIPESSLEISLTNEMIEKFRTKS
jgi:NAD+ diphosphatase